MPTTSERELHEAGLRVTAGRRALLDALESSPHSDAVTLHRLLVEADAGTSLQSVHNVLADLTAAGLLRKIEPANSAARYERRIGDNHHHIVCTSCGAVADVECVVGHAPCLTPSDTAGFTLASAEVTFWGLCADCQSAPSR
ncbi:Fur family transcriptional regulator [Conyzicola nivalis]|uniref:Ferric uptake regulation protein FurA n=1 Tax=Conyzicola nivalis TaxID=1477021 RepID=A0A916SMA3_9MICO|nr:Fur family transcriptional regulator [Conyzicola nivalis]GGB03335.1 ferric uptake regulation protein FurA [Conyzicola nivalis]